MSSKIEELLGQEPFLPHKEQVPLFKGAMQEALAFHRANSDFYRDFLASNGCPKDRFGSITDIPPLPVGIFKERILLSVPESDIVKVTHSSATTSGKPSSILIDDTTRSRQRMALAKIMGAVLGNNRRPFIVFDNQDTLRSADGELGSRATTVRGLLSFSDRFFCVLDSSFNLDNDFLQQAIEGIGGKEAVIFGVTTILHDVLNRYKDDNEVCASLKRLNSPWVLLSGGWKKLAALNVDQEQFKQDLSVFFSTSRAKIIEFYGMIEQPGVIYPECGQGFKHIPAYGSVIIRDLKTMQSLALQREGMIEVLSPLPHSYPGIALLTDDLGRMEGDNGCACGRPGPFFSFIRRAPEAEAKGCADTLAIPY